MKKILLMFPILILVYWGCEEEQEVETDITPPNISVEFESYTYIIDGVETLSYVTEIVPITVFVDDDGGINKVEFYIDGVLVITDTESPYKYQWNTLQYEDGSEHILRVVVYDNAGNEASYETTVLVDIEAAIPGPPEVISVTYTLTEMTVE